MATGIPYVNEGWGLFVGCTKIETGCVHCWANDLHTKRHKAYGASHPRADKAGRKMPGQYARPFWTVQFLPERLDQPARWRKPRDIFVCPMSDFFHKDISPCDRARAIRAMKAVPRHRYFIFTKRTERARSFFSTFATQLPNLWLMLSLSTREEADRKIPMLLNTNVAHRGLSLEPLLENIDLKKYLTGISVGVESDYENTNESQTGGRKIDTSCSGRRASDRFTRSNLAIVKEGGNQEPSGKNTASSFEASQSRTRYGRILNNSRHVEQQTNIRPGESIGVETFLRQDSAGPDNQSQGRRQEKESSQQFGVGDIQRTGDSLSLRSKEKSEIIESEGREKPSSQVDKKGHTGNTPKTPSGREIESHSQGLRDSLSNSFDYRQTQKLGLAHIIVGCESGPKRRPCNIEWVRSIVRQCKEAGVAVYVKQLNLPGCLKCGFNPCTHLHGHKQIDILVTDPKDFPEDLRIREVPI